MRSSPRCVGPHVRPNGKKARATLHQGPCGIANKAILPALKPARTLSPVSVGIILGGGQSYMAECRRVLSIFPSGFKSQLCELPSAADGLSLNLLSGPGSPSLQVLPKLRPFIGYLIRCGRPFSSPRHQRLLVVWCSLYPCSSQREFRFCAEVVEGEIAALLIL